MKFATFTASIIAASFATTAAFAQAGVPTDPTSDKNKIPAPSIENPGDPAAADNPAARVPTAPEGTYSPDELGASGAGAGTAGSDDLDPMDDNDEVLDKPVTSDPAPN